MVRKVAFIKDLGFSNETHLCDYCSYRIVDCPEADVIFGTAAYPDPAVPNICCCSAFERSIDVPREQRTRPKAEAVQPPKVKLPFDV